MPREIDHHIAELARSQHGVVTRAQLIDIGLSAKAVRHRAATHRLLRLYRGVYLFGAIMPPYAREMAAVLACGPDAVLSHFSAAITRKLISIHSADRPVEVTIFGGRHCRPPGILVRRVKRLDPDERTSIKGIPVTTVARTLVDLASVADRHELERAIATAERERVITRTELESLPDRYRGRPGQRLFRAILAAQGGPALTRSEAEARFLGLIRRARLPMPEANVVVEGYELDFLWRAHRIAVEIDGYRYHGSRPQFEKDRRRATDLAARGIQVIPLTWRQIVDDDMATAVKLGQALLRADQR